MHTVEQKEVILLTYRTSSEMATLVLVGIVLKQAWLFAMRLYGCLACNCHLTSFPLLLPFPLHWFPIKQLPPLFFTRRQRVTPSGWTSCRLASSSWAALATPQIDRPLNCSSLPSVTHHKKQEATTELHSQFSFLSSPVNSPSSPPSPLPPFSHAQKTPTFGSRLTFTVYCS